MAGPQHPPELRVARWVIGEEIRWGRVSSSIPSYKEPSPLGDPLDVGALDRHQSSPLAQHCQTPVGSTIDQQRVERQEAEQR